MPLVPALGLVLVAGMQPCRAQTPEIPQPAPKILWERDYDAALARAQKENKPLFVAFLMDDEPANDETIYQHYPDQEILKLSAKFVCLACCVGEHPADDEGLCTKFPGTTCAQHQAVEKKARARWTTEEYTCAPQHVFCTPAGEVILRKVYIVPKDTLKKCMLIALHTVNGDPEAQKYLEEEKAQVDRWLKDLDGRNLELKQNALSALAESEDERALPAILRHAKAGNDDPVRLAAIGVLAKKGNFKAVKPLVGMLTDRKAQIVIAAGRALETIQMAEATPGVMRALVKERRDRVRGFLLRAAARSAPGNIAVREACMKSLKGASAQLEPCVLMALGRMQANSTIIEAMKARLGDNNQNIRGLAVWVLGSQATPECAAVLQDLLKVERTPEVTAMANSALKRCRGEKVTDYENLFTTFFSDGDYQ